MMDRKMQEWTMSKTILATEPPVEAGGLRQDLIDAGLEIVAETSEAADLPQAVIRTQAELVVAISGSPSPVLFEAAKMLNAIAPRPFILFTSDRDAAKINRASDSGIHAYVVDGYARHRLPAIVQVAKARFRHDQRLKNEIGALTKRFEERKTVDRAKGLLMRSRGVSEEEAFELLRALAMHSRQRIGVVAASVIDMSRAGEAVNKAGQLRMLSQRIALAYAQAVSDRPPGTIVDTLADSVERVEANLAMLRRAISAKGYGDFVDRVVASWQELKALLDGPPQAQAVERIDARAEQMLDDAERLTGFLESSGLVTTLHIINVAGRQRMLSQRIAKLCFLLALNPEPARLRELRDIAAKFQEVLDYLNDVPLSSAAIRTSLEQANLHWASMSEALGALGDRDTLVRVAFISEQLLGVFERLAQLYEQSMQMLIGDQIGRIG
jgi:AmiR/NasT family two-component response regulator